MAQAAQHPKVPPIIDTMQKLVGLHRQLMEIVRAEKEALVQADIRAIQESTGSKQTIIESIKLEEANRIRQVAELAMAMKWKKPIRELTLTQIAVLIQGDDPRSAETLRTTFNALTIMIKRVSEINEENNRLVAKTLEHIHSMKRNVLGEATPVSGTYTQQGTKATGSAGSRLISKEA